jgi:FPC/CPF motif-containing protein YcgG
MREFTCRAIHVLPLLYLYCEFFVGVAMSNKCVGATVSELSQLFKDKKANNLTAIQIDIKQWIISYCINGKKRYLSCSHQEKKRVFRTELALFKVLFRINPIFKIAFL